MKMFSVSTTYLSFFIFSCVQVASTNAQIAGTLDSTFNQTGIVHNQPSGQYITYRKVILAPNDKIITIGASGFNAAVTRFNSNGSIDSTFGSQGLIIVNAITGTGLDGLVLPDGKIMVLINNGSGNGLVVLARLLPDGNLDTSFGTGGVAKVNVGITAYSTLRLILQPDGKMIALGSFVDDITFDRYGFVSRFLPNGTLDATFGTSGTARIITPSNTDLYTAALGLQSDDKIVVSGRTSDNNNEDRWYVTRLMPDGLIDSSFATNGAFIKNLGGASESANELLILPNGNILVAGNAEKSQVAHFTILRIKPNGELDNSFGVNGKAQVALTCCFSSIFGLRVQDDGKLVACGFASNGNGRLLLAVARFNSNGLLDQSFGTGGSRLFDFKTQPTDLFNQQRALSAVIQPDHKILLTGYSDNNNTPNGGLLLRLNPGMLVDVKQISDKTSSTILYPNPISAGDFTLQYVLEKSIQVSITLYDLQGKRIAELLPPALCAPGDHQENLKLPNVVAGSYLIKIETPEWVKTIKFIKK